MKVLQVILFSFVLLSPSKKPGQNDLSDGLVAHYPFNGNANDASGNGNHAIFNNATLTVDKAGNLNGAYYFNGTSSYMRVPNSPSLNPSHITMMAVVKVQGFYRGDCHGNVILHKGDNDNGGLSDKYRLRFADDLYTSFSNCGTPNVDTIHQAFYGDFGNNGHSTLPYSGPFLEKEKWYCLVFTFDGATARFYIDGVPTASKSTSNVYQPGATDLFIGRMNDALFPYWFNGVIDEIRIYNRALSAAEVTSLCSTTLPLTLKEFRGSAINGFAKLSWTTLDETGTDSINLQRSIDGLHFSTVSAIVPKKSSGENKYDYTEMLTTSDWVFYKLQFVQLDGSKKYSAVLPLNLGRANPAALRVIPNPAYTYLSLNYQSPKSGEADIRIIDVAGRQVHAQRVKVEEGNNTITIYKISKLVKGTYTLVLYQEGGTAKTTVFIKR